MYDEFAVEQQGLLQNSSLNRPSQILISSLCYELLFKDRGSSQADPDERSYMGQYVAGSTGISLHLMKEFGTLERVLMAHHV
jgi:hypothetical protein